MATIRMFLSLMLLWSGPSISGGPQMATTAKLTLFQNVTEPLAFSNPSLGLKGTIRPLPGDRLQMVVITLGDVPIEADPRATLAFVYELPEGSAMRAVRLPDGSELAIRR